MNTEWIVIVTGNGSGGSMSSFLTAHSMLTEAPPEYI